MFGARERDLAIESLWSSVGYKAHEPTKASDLARPKGQGQSPLGPHDSILR
jgi:hypothetical protein